MAIDFPTSPVPEICISPAPYEEPIEEPKSPFACLSPVRISGDDEYRPALLTPPPVHSPRASPLSPLRPADAPVKSQGLERERFEALLRASRERNASLGGSRRPQDLRKEVALKAHKTKQSERRALFLSKLQAPPSPTAAIQPKTPPESPAVLHYSLPSPGLNSPLAHFDMLAHQHGDMRKPWVEQVDFRLPESERTKVDARAYVVSPPKAKALPSLAEISARLSSQGQLPTVKSSASVNAPELSSCRLPAFLQKGSRKQAPPSLTVVTAAPTQEPAPKRRLLPMGRLQLRPRPEVTEVEQPRSYPMPRSPSSPTINVTTSVVSRVHHIAPVELSESNLQAFNTRASKAKDMLSTLRRRSLVTPIDTHLVNTASNQHPTNADDIERHIRRRSAPAELQQRERQGFAHPVLTLPGGF